VDFHVAKIKYKHMKKKILIVFGTRPEAIKMVPLVKEFQKNENHFITKVCVTAQHRELLDQVLQVFEIKPDYDLNLMSKNQNLYDITSKVLLEIKKILDEFKPDFVFVHGDTTTTMSASLAAFYNNVKIAHIEAGLRTGNIYSPFPEEVNRKITSVVTNLHFAPTLSAKSNLLKENYCEKDIIITGNTVIDTLKLAIEKIKLDIGYKKSLFNEIENKGYRINTRKIILVTGHRRENFGQGFENICNALLKISKHFQDIDIVYPVHLNPNVKSIVNSKLDNQKNIYLLEPLDYFPFIYLMSESYLVLTDSGGIQEEAPGLGKPVLVMRDVTERPEAVEAGTVKLVGTDEKTIVENVSQLIEDLSVYEKMSKSINPYGMGNASYLIVQKMLNLYK